jgi:hypothetical protein
MNVHVEKNYPRDSKINSSKFIEWSSESVLQVGLLERISKLTVLALVGASLILTDAIK